MNDPIVAGRQAATRQWWQAATANYRCLVSKVVADECGAGDSDLAIQRMAVLDQLEFVATTSAVDLLARLLIDNFAVPKSEPRDAVHISLAAVHGLEYLVSWNFRHIVNPKTRSKIEDVCRTAGYTPPLICTPDELMEVEDGS